tara:strand:+ start:634 stop:975 length:342 start_codon:yes stop_codon:yes gene_type:complete
MNLTSTNDSLAIRIRSIGHVPAFKNKKIIAGKRLITAPKARKWMEAATASMHSQLKSLFQTEETATSTEPWQLSAIAWWPRDDNWKVIPRITVSVRVVPKGEEGANIFITPLK